jgi:putative cell wall-binding protein
MKVILFISLAITFNIAVASLEFSEFSNDQICMFTKDPPISEEVTLEINERGIACNEGIVIIKSEIPSNKSSAISLRIKKWNKALRGKGPIYSTRSGTNFKIDSFGDEKSITIDRSF